VVKFVALVAVLAVETEAVVQEAVKVSVTLAIFIAAAVIYFAAL
jgi:hypothetical protein